MPSTLSATAPAFLPPPRSSASTTAELLFTIVCRKNEEIGTYEDGILRPRKGVTSLITWEENTPFTTVAPFATDAPFTKVVPVPFASSDKAAIVQPATPLVGPGMIEILQTNFTSGDALEFQQDEELTFDMPQPDAPNDYHYEMLPPQIMDLQEHIPINQPLSHPAPTLFHPPTYQPHVTLPCDIAVSEANRPAWNPAYHKAISPSIERANRVVEEFKVYFGDGRSPDILTQLQKICFLCGLCEAYDLPQTTNGCIAILREIYINVFDLVEIGRADEQGWVLNIPIFRSSKQFFDYSREEGKVCPRWIGKANPLFQNVMNRFR